jgi:hypothetical protein
MWLAILGIIVAILFILSETARTDYRSSTPSSQNAGSKKKHTFSLKKFFSGKKNKK